MTIWRLRRSRGTMRRVTEAEDLVNDAIAKTIAGVRIWNPESCPLYQHLVGVIFSDISHAATSQENRVMVTNHRPSNGGTTWPPDIPDETPNQEEICLCSSDQRRLLDHLGRIELKMGRMAELMLLRDVTETEHLCCLLELAPSEVANLRKRMKRAARTYYAEIRT